MPESGSFNPLSFPEENGHQGTMGSISEIALGFPSQGAILWGLYPI